MIGYILVYGTVIAILWVLIIWFITGKWPASYDMFKSIKLIELPSGEYEIHVYHGPFRKTVSALEPEYLKWFRWYKVTSKFAVHRMDSPLATFETRSSAIKVIDKIKSKKAEYF